jgi:hypothetical protein
MKHMCLNEQTRNPKKQRNRKCWMSLQNNVLLTESLVPKGVKGIWCYCKWCAVDSHRVTYRVFALMSFLAISSKYTLYFCIKYKHTLFFSIILQCNSNLICTRENN